MQMIASLIFITNRTFLMTFFFELCICLTLRQIGIHNLISPSPFELELAIEFSIIRTSLSLSLPRYYDPQINEEGAIENRVKKSEPPFWQSRVRDWPK